MLLKLISENSCKFSKVLMSDTSGWVDLNIEELVDWDSDFWE